MEFGRVDENELAGIDFSLPAEPLYNEKILPGRRSPAPKIYMGCAKWGRTEWVGKIYPPKTKERDFLSQYVKHYNCIELNATHYKVYGGKAIAGWAAQAAGKDFMFCTKMYQGVTHRASLKGKSFLTNEFLRGVVEFRQHLGPIFVQVSDTFSPNRREELVEFLSSLPKDLQFFVEVRHPHWFANRNVLDYLLTALKEMQMGLVITDTAGRRDCAHMHLAIPKAFIRFVGNSLHPTDFTRIDEWALRMKHWIDNGIEELYFFMHMHDEATSPELTVYLADKINAVCGLDLQKPVFMNAPTLF